MNSVDLGTYLGQLEARRTTPNGIFGMQLHYHQWFRAFGKPIPDKAIVYLNRQDRLIFITRSDKVAQAASVATPNAGEGGDQCYEWANGMVIPISQALVQVVSEDLGWRQFLSRTKRLHLEVRCEDY